MEKYNHEQSPSPASQEREDASQLLQRAIRNVKNIDGLDGKTVEQIFDPEDENTRREFIAQLSDEQYCQLITGINGILRRKKKEEWDMDGDGVTAIGEGFVGAHIFPNYKHKKEILIKSFESAQEMNAEQRDLEDIGMLLGSLLVETHPFADGNGRTSRLVYFMIKSGSSAEEMKVILGEDGRDELDMALSKQYLDDLFEQKYGRGNEEINRLDIHGLFSDEESIGFKQLQFPEGTSEGAKNAIVNAGRNDDKILISAILHFINAHPETSTGNCIKEFGARRIFLLQNLLAILSSAEVEKLANTYWEIKKQYTEDMIDVFVHPDKPEYKIEKNGTEMRMIDYFKERIAQKQMLY